jgi:hypothetical protein
MSTTQAVKARMRRVVATKGNITRTYVSLAAAGRDLGIHHSQISFSLKTGRLIKGGYGFKYDEP